jgi:hypothetical protein
MAQTQRTAAQARIARSQAIRRDRQERAARTTTAAPRKSGGDMPADLLAACVAAAGFDQNAGY